jgi:hypothetical protein
LPAADFDRNETHVVSRTGHSTQKARRLQFTRLLPRSDDTPSAPYPDPLERGLSDAPLFYRRFSLYRWRGRFRFGATTRETKCDQSRAE